MFKIIGSGFIVAVMISGCSMDPKYVEEDFGQSVRQMLLGQIYDPKAASNPDEDPLFLLDGVTAGNSVEGYRDDSKRENRKELRGFTIE